MDVWPDNWRAVMLFNDLSRQWRVGMNGPYGLDYNVLYRKMDRMKLSDEECDELEREISVLEEAALAEMHQKN